MRRVRFCSLLTALLLTAVPSMLHATPYASNITVTGGTTVNFSLNEPSDVLTYSINGGTPVALDGTTKGAKTFSLGAPTDTFSIVADKTSAVGYTIPTGGTINAATSGLSRISNAGGVSIISDDTSVFGRYNSPRGVSVSKDPNASNFGTVYVANSAAGSVAASGSLPVRSLGDGLYAIRSDGSDAFAYGDTAQNPTNTIDGFPLFILNSASSPYRVTIGGDGQVYVADWADVNSNAFILAPDLLSGRNLLDGYTGTFGNANPDGTSLPAAQNHGSAAAVYVEGSAATGDLVLYTIDEDMNSAHVSGVTTDPQNDRNSIWKYTLGSAATPATAMPTKIAGGPGYLIGDVPTGSITVDFDRGADGKFYMSQYRSAGLQAGLVVTDASGAILWDSLSTSRAITPPTDSDTLSDPADYNRRGEVDAADYVLWRKGVAPLLNEVNDGTTGTPAGGIGVTNGNDYTAWRSRFGIRNDILTNLFNIAISPDQKWLAGMVNGSDMVVIPLINGIPDLPNRMVLDTANPNVNSARDIAFDAAGNIHYVSSGQGLYRVLSPGGHSIATTTWNGSAYSFGVAYSGSGSSLGGGAAVPEPGTMGLAMLGLGLAGLCRRRR